MAFDNLKKLLGVSEEDQTPETNDSGLQQLRDVVNVNQDRIKMGLNPSLQGPTSNETTLPSEAAYNKDVANNVASGSLKSGDSAKSAEINADINATLSPVKSYTKEKYEALKQALGKILERPSISREDKVQAMNRLNTYRKMAQKRGVTLEE